MTGPPVGYKLNKDIVCLYTLLVINQINKIHIIFLFTIKYNKPLNK